MFLSSRIKNINEAITLKLNEKAQDLHDSGVHVYNLTNGQLPFKPMPEFTNKIVSQVNFLKSFQYSPPAGFPELREKFIAALEQSRQVSFPREEFGAVISNGAKHTIYNILGAVVDPGDEVVIIAPYWISYPEMIKFWGGVPIVVKTKSYNAYMPDIDDLKKALTPRTKMIIINSPNNPSGLHYPETWMNEFGEMMKEFPDTWILSDEIYCDLFYYDPKPTYYYQKHKELLDRTIIVEGISKTFASPGLRIGYCVAPRKLAEAVTLVQAQTTSGPSSLIQRSLIDFDFNKNVEFLNPVKIHLRRNSDILREAFRKGNLDNCWYQTTSAFYFTLDFTGTPCFEKYANEAGEDMSTRICEDILRECSVALVPTTDFGISNAARISMVLDKDPFTQAMDKLVQFLVQK